MTQAEGGLTVESTDDSSPGSVQKKEERAYELWAGQATQAQCV